MNQIRTIDAHTAGEPLRLIVEGFPRLEGTTMLERREWVRAHCDHLRTALMLEPRGHTDMYGALFTEPENADSEDSETCGGRDGGGWDAGEHAFGDVAESHHAGDRGAPGQTFGAV